MLTDKQKKVLIQQKSDAKKKAKGLCRCGKRPFLPGRVLCQECATKNNEHTKEFNRARRAKGLCACGKTARPGRSCCEVCTEKLRLSAMKRNNRLREQGLCVTCGKQPPAPEKTKCHECAARHRQAQRKINYGISPEQYQHLLAKQDYRCPICDKRLASRTHVDHDHKTGHVRGILCGGCNTFLGKFEARQHRLGQILAYLEQPPGC